MKKEYELKKLKKRNENAKSSVKANKIAISFRVDSEILIFIKTEAERLGIPYQTLIGSVLHRYSTGELVDLKSVNIDEIIKKAS